MGKGGIPETERAVGNTVFASLGYVKRSRLNHVVFKEVASTVGFALGTMLAILSGK